MSRSLRQDRPSSRLPAHGQDTPAHLVALRGRVPDRDLRPPPPPPSRAISLQTKLLVSYVLLGAFLVGAVPLVQRVLGDRIFLADVILLVLTLVVGYALATAVLRVNRLARLRISAVEISGGDLSKAVASEMARGFQDEVDGLADSIRTMQENLRDLVSRIQRTAQSVAESANELQTAAGEVNASTDEVASSMAKIAQGADEQSGLVERTSKVIGDIAASIERTARSAQEAAKASADTSSGAAQSGEAARLAAEKVKKVFSRIEAAGEQVFAFGERTREITQIVEVITSISRQTNLLALNATIEAARAGEYGRGFAVVAEEVRKLAESSGRSAEQISAVAAEVAARASGVVQAMHASVAELSEGREDLNAIMRSLDGITGAATAGAEKVRVISEAARDQMQGSADMVRAMDDISDVATGNATSTEQVRRVILEQTASVSQMASAAQELLNLSLELQSVVSRFRLDR